MEKHKYNSLEEILEVIDKKNWNDLRMDEIKDIEENRQIVEDGIFWCAVECVRFTYSKDSLHELMKWFVGLKELWNKRKNGENYDD